MKKSHIDWCPMIPDHWEEKRIKDIAYLQSGNSITSMEIDEEGEYPVYGGNGKRGYTNRYTNEGDYVLIGRQGALCGNINYAHGKFYATEHAVVVYAQKEEITYWLGETLKAANLNRLSMTAAQPGLAVSAINLQFIPYPPREERIRIAAYLDTKLSEIDHQVSLLTSKRDAYLRLKKSIINRAVTKGLNPDVQMKDSGVDWIGMIPEGWKVVHMKRALSFNNGRDYKNIEVDEGYPVIGSGGQFAYASEYLYDGEAILFGRKGTIDKPMHINDKFWTVDTMFYATPKSNAYGRYLYYQATAMPLNKYSTQTALPSMTQTSLQNILICFPPLSEQQAIAAYLDEKCSKIDTIVANLDKQISKYADLKRSLIDEVITGKRAV